MGVQPSSTIAFIAVANHRVWVDQESCSRSRYKAEPGPVACRELRVDHRCDIFAKHNVQHIVFPAGPQAKGAEPHGRAVSCLLGRHRGHRRSLAGAGALGDGRGSVGAHLVKYS